MTAARAAIDRHVAQPLGMTVEQAAWGIHQIVNESMASAARVHTLERGKDPRGLPVFAFGGAGPVHGHRVALALGAPALIAPFGAGVMSAIGFLSAPLAFDFVRSAPGRLDDLDWERINALLDEMQAEGQALLVASGVPAAQITHRRVAEMRYAGQGHEISVPLIGWPAWPRRCTRAARGVRNRVSAAVRPARPAGAAGGDHLARVRIRPHARAAAALRRRTRATTWLWRARARAWPTSPSWAAWPRRRCTIATGSAPARPSRPGDRRGARVDADRWAGRAV